MGLGDTISLEYAIGRWSCSSPFNFAIGLWATAPPPHYLPDLEHVKSKAMATGNGESVNPAYDAFRKHSAELLATIQDSEVTALAWDLFTKEFISAPVHDAATYQMHDKYHRASNLLKAVGSRLDVDPGEFDVFLSALARLQSMADLCERMKYGIAKPVGQDEIVWR